MHGKGGVEVASKAGLIIAIVIAVVLITFPA